MATKTISRDAAHEELFLKAHDAGNAAANAAVPTPMHVVQRAHPLDDSSPIVKRYAPVMDGVCGFAWVRVTPGTSSFARWLTRTEHGRKAYQGGVSIWVGGYGQSYERKSAYADAFAAVLNEAGITARSEGRLD